MHYTIVESPSNRHEFFITWGGQISFSAMMETYPVGTATRICDALNAAYERGAEDAKHAVVMKFQQFILK